MQTKPKSIEELRADQVYKMLAAVGFLLNSFDELNRLTGFQGSVFSMSLKNAAKKFKVQLEAAERMITHGNYQTSETMMQQMADSYEVIDNLLTLMLEAGRILTPEAMDLFSMDLYATAKKWGVVIESSDVYTQTDKTK